MLKRKILLLATVASFITLGVSGLVMAAGHGSSPTWRNAIAPMVEAKCAMCHGDHAPEVNEWNLLGDERKTTAPRMNTYPHFMSFVVWPETGAMMRRIDDGSASGGSPGNMYQYLGNNDQERAKNLQTIKTWLGEGAWNLNRFNVRGDTPGISKEQLAKIKAPY